MIKERNALVPRLTPTLKYVNYVFQYKDKSNQEWKYYSFCFTPEELTPNITVDSLEAKLYRKFQCAETRWYNTVRNRHITCSECGYEVLIHDEWAQCEKCKTHFEQFKHVDEKFYPTTLLSQYEEEIKNLLSEDEEFWQDIDYDDECSYNFSVSATRYKDKWAMYVWVNENYDDPEDEAYSYSHSRVYWIGEEKPRHWIGEYVSTVPNMDRYMKYVNRLNGVHVQEI